MQRVGQVDKTVDSEFAQEEARYRSLEKTALSLQKEAKNYLDSIRGASCLGLKAPEVPTRDMSMLMTMWTHMTPLANWR